MTPPTNPADAWAAWAASINYHGAATLPHGRRHRLTVRTRPLEVGAPAAAALPAELLAWHLAVITEPEAALDRRVFEVHALWRPRDIKRAAAEFGVCRQHWYRLVAGFTARVQAKAEAMLAVRG